MGLARILPSRAKVVESQDNDELLCDLDVVISRRVTFRYRGQTHVLEPITSERFFDFYTKFHEFQKRPDKTGASADEGFFKLIRSICATITLADIRSMTIIQKGDLVAHLISKITGVKRDETEKKSPVTQMTPSSQG